MRWLTLYARSRQVASSAAAVALIALVVWAFNRGGGTGAADARDVADSINPVAYFVLAASVAAGSVGLGGQDPSLDRTAAIRWAPRRAAHALLIGAVAGAALLAIQAVGPKFAPTEVVVRDSAGLVGLAALGAVLCGAHLAWTLPTGWLAITVLTPPMPPNVVGKSVGWMVYPAGTEASTWAAVALLVTGAGAYALAGPRR
ncbi:hypothetical protein ACIPLC_09130 [Kitasatospora sp. NPDC086801]|uniref:hypothetical protein n=1 Tax=Kitasatospora sp. NPDC086801 TaxID=3364066 RepID=UPI00380FB451